MLGMANSYSRAAQRAFAAFRATSDRSSSVNFSALASPLAPFVALPRWLIYHADLVLLNCRVRRTGATLKQAGVTLTSDWRVVLYGIADLTRLIGAEVAPVLGRPLVF